MSAADISSLAVQPDEKPSLSDLWTLQGSGGKKVKIIETIASKWEQLAMALGFDGHTIDNVKRDFERDCEGASHKILRKWLEETDSYDNLKLPVSWSTLIQCLRDIEYSSLCDDIQMIIDQPPILQSIDL